MSKCRWGCTRRQYHYGNTTHKYTSHIHNTHITYTQIHLSHKITPPKTNKQNKEKQASSQSHTNSEGHITANEYSVEKGEELNLSPIPLFLLLVFKTRRFEDWNVSPKRRVSDKRHKDGQYPELR
jgi:hypothetical protein